MHAYRQCAHFSNAFTASSLVLYPDPTSLLSVEYFTGSLPRLNFFTLDSTGWDTGYSSVLPRKATTTL